MKIPQRPPATSLVSLTGDVEKFTAAWSVVDVVADRYLSWEEMRNRKPPSGLTRGEWWAVTALKREGAARILPLKQINGKPFWFTLPDEAMKMLNDIAMRAGGGIGMRERVVDGETRDRYLVRGLMEEAITSSQMEGAMTTRRVAKEMLRSGRAPVTKDELMILNNFHGMEYVRENQNLAITPERVFELHRILVNGTLEREEDAGRLQCVDEERIHVGTDDGVVIHEPPRAHTLPKRLEILCDFASGSGEDVQWVSPIARAIFTHFMVGYDHYFVDGNGRLARTLFYWVMLREGFWLTDFATISTILKKAPGQYARSYLNSEYEGDVTFFLLYQLNVVSRALTELDEYLERQTRHTEGFKRSIHSEKLNFNHRQIAILEEAFSSPALDVTIDSHARFHRVSPMTARSDLHDLEHRGLLVRHKEGRRHHWWPARNLEEALNTLVQQL